MVAVGRPSPDGRSRSPTPLRPSSSTPGDRALTKRAARRRCPVGVHHRPVTYTYVATNAGNMTLSRHHAYRQHLGRPPPRPASPASVAVSLQRRAPPLTCAAPHSPPHRVTLHEPATVTRPGLPRAERAGTTTGDRHGHRVVTAIEPGDPADQDTRPTLVLLAPASRRHLHVRPSTNTGPVRLERTDAPTVGSRRPPGRLDRRHGRPDRHSCARRPTSTAGDTAPTSCSTSTWARFGRTRAPALDGTLDSRSQHRHGDRATDSRAAVHGERTPPAPAEVAGASGPSIEIEKLHGRARVVLDPGAPALSADPTSRFGRPAVYLYDGPQQRHRDPSTTSSSPTLTHPGRQLLPRRPVLRARASTTGDPT